MGVDQKALCTADISDAGHCWARVLRDGTPSDYFQTYRPFVVPVRVLHLCALVFGLPKKCILVLETIRDSKSAVELMFAILRDPGVVLTQFRLYSSNPFSPV